MTFDSGLKTREKRVGLIYLPVHVFGLPLALGLLSPLIPDVGRWLPTAVYYGVGLAVLATAMGGYLGRQLGVLARTPGRAALSVLLGLLLWLSLTLLLGIILALCRCMERSGTVWACVGMHIVNNALALALLGR